jgi:murein DD-endopeptidase MepM/ murein hydrolase activator NlpD
MVAEPSNWGRRLFPTVCIQFRKATRSSQIALSPAVQVSALAAFAAAATAFAYLGISQIGYVRLVFDKELAVARIERANIDLQGDVANLRDRLAVSTRDRAVAEDRFSALAREASTLRGQLELTEMKLLAIEQSASEHETTTREQTTVGEPVELGQSQPTSSEPIPTPRESGAPDLTGEARRSAERGAELSRRAIGEFKRVLASAGVDVARLFSRFGANHGEGGPFVLPPRADQPAGPVNTDELAVFRGLARSLPLSTPLEHYQIGSRFGPRHDPFNGKPAFHSGLDFDAGYMSPVYATAPGIVTYAGYRRDYGKVVEIDHGSGIVTLYGHMHRYTVSVGQRVEAHMQIGLVGSTGRASGPHVHYEVIVNGQPEDPERFIELARLVPIAAK